MKNKRFELQPEVPNIPNKNLRKQKKFQGMENYLSKFRKTVILKNVTENDINKMVN